MKKYPRFFIYRKEGEKGKEKTWMSYATVKNQRGKIFQKIKPNKFIPQEDVLDSNGYVILGEYENFAEKMIKNGEWIEVDESEIALIG